MQNTYGYLVTNATLMKCMTLLLAQSVAQT
jgi:hypothetical protein